MYRLHSLIFFLFTITSSFVGNNTVPATGNNPLKLKCIYRLTFQPDSTNSKDVRTEDMLLYIGEQFSKFESRNNALFDSVVADLEHKGGIEYLERNGINASALPKTKYKFEIYKNYPAGEITVIDKIATETYKYTEPKEAIKWTISPGKTNIAGYNCQKAITNFAGRQYEAWFTSEIPVSEGPYKFQGLPGLIVKLADTRNHYTFELISLKQATKPELVTFPDDRLIPTTKKDFNKGIRDYNANIAARMGQMVTTNNPEEAARRAKERAKKNNNPIELTD